MDICRGCEHELKPGVDDRDGVCSGASRGAGPWCYDSFTDFASGRCGIDPRLRVGRDHLIDWTRPDVLVAWDQWLALGRPVSAAPSERMPF